MIRPSERLVAALILAGAALVLYLPYLGNPLVFDDLPFFEQGGFENTIIAGINLEKRTLPYFLTAWVEMLSDRSLGVQRIINLALHVACTLTLYTLIIKLTSEVAPHVNNKRAALAAALLFLLHPLAVYAVGYLIQRTILMATLFGLLFLNAHLDGLITRRRSYFVVAAFFYFASALSKEHAILMPALALVISIGVARFNRELLARMVLPSLLYLPTFLFVVFGGTIPVGQAYEPQSANFLSTHVGMADPLHVWMLSAITQASLFFKYLMLMLLPVPVWMSVDLRVPFASHLAEPKYVLGGLAYMVYGAVALYLIAKKGRKALLGMALIAPWLLFGVEFSSVRIQEPFVLYRTYLWMPLLFLMVPFVTHSWPGRIFWPLLIGLCILLALASRDRLDSFSGTFELWNDAVQKLPADVVPGVERAYFNRGNEFIAKKDVSAAIQDYSRAIEVNPGLPELYLNRAYAYWQRNDLQRAEDDVEVVLKAGNAAPQAHFLDGLLKQKRGMDAEAQQSFEQACKLGSMAGCYANKGREDIRKVE